MALTKIGKTFKNKTGKSTTLVLSREDLKKLETLLTPTEKYGDQVRLIITGTASSQYGHSVSVVEDDEDTPDLTDDDNQTHQPINEDDLNF